MRSSVRLFQVRPSPRPGKKLMALFSDGSTVHFGGQGCKDFTIYWKEFGRKVALKKRDAYIRRHRVNESWLDPKAPGTLARIVLWQFPTIAQAVKCYDATVQKWQQNPALRYS